MKKIITAVAVTLFACSAAYATGLSETIMDPQVIAADTSATASSTGSILAILATILILMGAMSAL